MAKSEPSINYDNTPQESSPKPFKDVKDFKDVANSQDFYAFFESKFQLIESQVENHQPYKLFKVAEKETLTAFATKESDPYKLEVGTYNFILYETKQSKLKVRVFGALASFQDVEKKYFDRSLPSAAFSNEMNQLKYCDSDVNYSLFLLGKTKEEKFVKGKLESYTRDEKGRVIARSNLADLLKRRKIWNSKHPKPKEKHYSNKECKKAKCLRYNYKEGTCDFLLQPSNNKEGEKLPKAVGYCFDYVSKYQRKFETALLKLLEKERLKITRKFSKSLEKFKQTRLEPFNHNITSPAPAFNNRDFSIFVSILNDLEETNFVDLIESYDNMAKSIDTEFDELISIGKEFCYKAFNRKGFKKIRAEFETSRSNLLHERQHEIFQMDAIRRKILIHNIMLRKLFRGLKGTCKLSFSTLQKGMNLYFRKAHVKDSTFSFTNKYTNFNVGRIKNLEGKWEDFYLSPIRWHSNYEVSRTVPEYPIFKVVAVKSREIEIQNAQTKQKVKLLSSRHYSLYLLYFYSQYKPKLKRTSQSDMNQFFN